jgi:hypothetical protein
VEYLVEHGIQQGLLRLVDIQGDGRFPMLAQATQGLAIIAAQSGNPSNAPLASAKRQTSNAGDGAGIMHRRVPLSLV